jgi:hypothetical protein
MDDKTIVSDLLQLLDIATPGGGVGDLEIIIHEKDEPYKAVTCVDLAVINGQVVLQLEARPPR